MELNFLEKELNNLEKDLEFGIYFTLFQPVLFPAINKKEIGEKVKGEKKKGIEIPKLQTICYISLLKLIIKNNYSYVDILNLHLPKLIEDKVFELVDSYCKYEKKIYKLKERIKFLQKLRNTQLLTNCNG